MKMKFALLVGISLFVVACTESGKETTADKTTAAPTKSEDLIKIENGVYSQYYEGMKQLKFQGSQDAEGRRHGVWFHYSKTGLELSITEYNHGKLNGLTVVKHPNGVIYYTGEYEDGKEVGVWKTYDTNGNLVTEKDFGR